MSVAGLVLGILSIVFALIPGLGLLGPIVGVVGIILATIGYKKSKALGVKDGMAMAGMVLSIIGTAISLLAYIACVACVGGLFGTANILLNQ